jgi:hypothetical protein
MLIFSSTSLHRISCSRRIETDLDPSYQTAFRLGLLETLISNRSPASRRSHVKSRGSYRATPPSRLQEFHVQTGRGRPARWGSLRHRRMRKATRAWKDHPQPIPWPCLRSSSRNHYFHGCVCIRHVATRTSRRMVESRLCFRP